MANIKAYFITLAIALTHFYKSKANPEIGFSTRLKSRFEVSKSRWTPIRGWENRGYLLLFEYGIKLDAQKQTARLPFSGLFFFSANLIIASKVKMMLQICITNNICQRSDQNEHTYTVAALGYFTKHEEVSVKLFADEDFAVLKDSTFAVQYLGSPSRMSGFLAVMPQNNTLPNNRKPSFSTIAGWSIQNEPLTRRSHAEGWSLSSKRLTVACSGMYLVTVTLSFYAREATYEIKLLSNITEIRFKKSFRYNGITTVSLLKNINLSKSDELKLEIKSPNSGDIHILSGSRFTAAYIAHTGKGFAEFSQPLDEITYRSGSDRHTLKDYLPTNVIQENDIKKGQNPQEQDSYLIAMPKHGVYVITLYLNMEISSTDRITADVLVFNEGLITIASLQGRPKLSKCDATPKKFEEVSLVLTGVLALGTHDLITISFKSSCKDSFAILKDSWISFMAVRSQDIAAGFLLQGQLPLHKSKSLMQGLLLNATTLNALPLGESLSNNYTEFRCPLRGIYLLSLNLVVSGSKSTKKTINIQVVKEHRAPNMKRTKLANPTPIFDVNVTTFEGLSTINPTFVQNLEENDYVSLRVSSRPQVTIREKSSFFISLIDFMESGLTFIAKLNQQIDFAVFDTKGLHKINYWLPKTAGSVGFVSDRMHVAPEDGYYTISCHIEVLSKSNVTIPNLELTLLVYFDDKSRNFGLRDKTEVSMKSNGTMNVFLNVNGVLEATKNAKLRTVIQVNKLGMNATIISGQLSMTYHAKTSSPPETFRNLQSSTRLLSFKRDDWLYLSKRVYENAKGEFKTKNIEFLGLHFYATKSIVAFVSATTILDGIEGILEYGVVLHSGSPFTLKGLTVEAELDGKSLKTLKWSGLVYMEPWQQLSLALRMKDGKDFERSGVNARTSWSSLSFLALSFPDSGGEDMSIGPNTEPQNVVLPPNHWFLNIQGQPRSANKIDIRSFGYRVAVNNVLSLRKGSFSKDIQSNVHRFQALSLPRFKLARTQMLGSAFAIEGRSKFHLNKVFSVIETLRSYFSGRIEMPCVVGILSLRLKLTTYSPVFMHLVYQTAKENVTLSAVKASERFSNVLEFNGIVCQDSLHSVFINGSSPFNATFAKNSTVSFSLIDSFSNIEGFNAMQMTNQMLYLKGGRATRVDGWLANHGFSFDASLGFKQPFGSYLVQTRGKYLVTANIILSVAANSEITVALYQDGRYITEASVVKMFPRDSMSTVNLVTLVDINKWKLLELKMTANHSVSTTILVGSTFSVILLDQYVTLDRCESDLLQIRALDNTETAHRIGADVALPCKTTDSRFADFYWLRNNQVVKFIPSTQDGTLVIKSAGENDTGDYQCQIQTGDFAALSHKMRVIVYDPRPVIHISNYTIQVLENSLPHQILTSVQVKAATARENENAVVLFTIEPSEMEKIFYVSPERSKNEAAIKSRILFDYETRSRFNFTLTATNENFHGIAKSSVDIQVRVRDQNDNPPEFEKSSYEVKILENTPVGETIHSVNAKDVDTGVNAEVQYSLHYNLDAEFFEIDKRSGTIRLKKSLTTQSRRSFTLFAIAKNKPFSTFAEVVIHVVDINDNRPYFNPALYRINITETTAVGSVVSRIYAYDMDVDPKNRNLTFQIKESANILPFDLDSSGNIRIIRKLESLAGETLTARVIAYDGHKLRSTNEAVIILRIVRTVVVATFSAGLRFAKDVYRIKIREDVSIGTPVVTVTAYYPENSHYRLRYIFIKPEDNFDFTISEKSGQIFTSSILDYENRTRYSLTVFACDVEGNSECTATKVEIDVLNVNDNLPQFSQVFYERIVREDAAMNSRVLQVKASDKDIGEHGDVSYKTDSNGGDLPFIIGEKDGIIRVAGKLKFLKTNSCLFTVSVSDDKKFMNRQQVLIKIVVKRKTEEVNLVKVPVFEKEFYEISLAEDFEVGKRVANPLLSSPGNAMVRYILVQNNNHTFKTDGENGGLFLLKTLDYEKRKSYDLFFIAELNNEITLRSCTRIRARVIDVNDNRPTFFHQNYETYIRGSLKPGRFVTKVQAIDQDSGTNSQITYNFDTNSTVKEFTIDSQNGDVKIKEVGKSSEYYLPLIACDAGSPQLCARSSITIHISQNTYEGGLPSSLLHSNYTFVEVEFDVEQYVSTEHDQLDIRFIAQEVHTEHPYYNQYSQLSPVTWYDVYYRRNEAENQLRRYVSSEKTLSFQIKQRMRRNVSGRRQKRCRFKYGSENDCGEIWKANRICNGPLQPGTVYRFQLEIRYPGARSFIKTGFTKQYKTGPVIAKSSPVSVKITKYKFPYWIALIAVSGVLLLLLLLLLIICGCCCREKKKQGYDVAIQKDNSFDDSYFQWKTETESQELTVWFSEESICNGSVSHGNSDKIATRL